MKTLTPCKMLFYGAVSESLSGIAVNKFLVLLFWEGVADYLFKSAKKVLFRAGSEFLAT